MKRTTLEEVKISLRKKEKTIPSFNQNLRISNMWRHKGDPNFNFTILGAGMKWHKKNRSVSITVSLLGINLVLSIQTQREIK